MYRAIGSIGTIMGKKIKAVIFEIVILKLKILAIHWFTRPTSIRVADTYIDVALEN